MGRASLGLCLAAVALATAGCFDDRGLVIEVDVGETGATSVELFLGQTACTDPAEIQCSGITPPGATRRLSGQVSFRDGSERTMADVRGGKASFLVKADTDTQLQIAIVVGSTSDGVVGAATGRSLKVPASDARSVELVLFAADALLSADRNPDIHEHIVVWPSPAGRESPICVGLAQDEPSGGTRDFIVPSADADCDKVANETDCNPTAYPGAGIDDAPYCVPATQPAGVCVLGAAVCQADNRKACLPGTRACAPAPFCACAELDSPCTRDKIDHDDIPRVVCEIPTGFPAPQLDLCSDNDRAEIDLSAYLPAADCEEEPQIAALDRMGFGESASFAGAVMKLSTAGGGAPCRLEIKWASGTRSDSSDVDYGLIKLTRPRGELLLPIVLSFQPLPDACAALQFKCSVLGSASDPLWSCPP